MIPNGLHGKSTLMRILACENNLKKLSVLPAPEEESIRPALLVEVLVVALLVAVEVAAGGERRPLMSGWTKRREERLPNTKPRWPRQLTEGICQTMNRSM